MNTPLQRVVALAAQIELGMRTIKTGALAGHEVRWGSHLPKNLPHGTIGEGRGIMQIRDPHTKATMTIERSHRKYAEGVEETGWSGGKHAYIANIHIPKKNRDTIAGGRALHKITSGVFDHFDNRGITASTLAGAYEKKGVAERAAGTHKLVQGYQKRGFKIDANAPALANDWNVPMVRRPGAGRNKPISERGYDRYMTGLRKRHIDASVEAVKDNARPLLKPAGAIAGAGAVVGGTAIAAHHEGNHQETAKKALMPAMIAGSVVAGGAAHHAASHIAKVAGETGDHLAAIANIGRVGIGKRLARNRLTRPFGRGLLHGLV